MPVFNETVSVTLKVVPASVDFQRIGPLETLVALWSGSSEALQSPQLADPNWSEQTFTKEAATFGDIGRVGQTYAVGGGSRGVVGSGRVQPAKSEVKLS